MASPLISVVVPTYGRATYLAEALASIRAQTIEDFECIVVDDASPDPVVLPVSDVRFRLVRHEVNRGPAGARNTGIRAASAPAIAFLDDDDLFTPVRLEAALDTLQRAPIGLCGGGDFPAYEGDVHSEILTRLTPTLGITAVRAEVCLPFDELYPACEDLDWWLRMSKAHPVASDPRVGWVWRRHSGPRGGHGDQGRIDGSLRLLANYPEYFREHPRAAAFRWYRIARLAMETGQPALRRRAAMNAARYDMRPRRLARAAKVFFHL